MHFKTFLAGKAQIRRRLNLKMRDSIAPVESPLIFLQIQRRFRPLSFAYFPVFLQKIEGQ